MNGSLLVRVAGAALLVVLVVGAAAWIDALRVGWGATPPVGWAESAGLARAGGIRLLAPILATLPVAVLLGAARRGASALGGGVLAGWAAALGLLAAGRFSIKAGWLLGALLVGVVAGRLAASALGRRGGAGPAPRGIALNGALALHAALLWAAMWAVPAIADGRPGGPHAAGAPRGIVLIVIDALRADHLGTYGYARPTSPNLDALARQGIVFADAVSPSSWTLPSMASFLTSELPGRTGVADRGDALPRGADDLASRLAAEGWRTAAISPNPWMKRLFGFDDGFAEYWDVDRLSLAQRLLGVRLKNLALRRLGRIRLDPEMSPEAHEVTERAVRWLRAPGDAPFFLYVHYMDVHAPYDPIPPYRGRFCRGHRFDRPDHLLESSFRSGRHAGDAEVLEHVVELYDEDILATDAAIGALVAGLASSGLDAGTALIVVADHGEEFYDHGGTTHGRTLYQELLHVPLILVPPRGAGARPGVVAGRVSTLDVYPTILEMAGLAAPDGIEGVSLLPRTAEGDEGAAPSPRVVGSQLFHDGRAWSALFAGSDKLIRGLPPAADPGAGSVVELYHLDRDPGERADAAAAEPERARGLVAALDGLERVWGIAGLGGKRPEAAIDEETLRQLKALGYLH